MVIEIMGKAPLQTNFRNNYVLVKMLYNIKECTLLPFYFSSKTNDLPQEF
jgi:CRISPR/Cas system CSM-associated protein Csm4 (group 5 of RAMP superfamily)